MINKNISAKQIVKLILNSDLSINDITENQVIENQILIDVIKMLSNRIKQDNLKINELSILIDEYEENLN